VNGETYAKYSQWTSREVGGIVMLERDFLGGIVRPLIGLRIWHTDVLDYTGQKVDAVNADGKKVEAIELPTKLREDFDAGNVRGFDGGFDDFVKLGLSYDTRDFEPDPNEGVLGQITAELGTNLVGSDFDYQRLTTSIAAFHDLAPEGERVVLAARAVYSMQFGDVPFFSQDTLAFNTFDFSGLGGGRTLRGFKRNRFVGDSAVLGDAEARWSLTEHVWGNQHFRPMLAVFFDTGRVYDDVKLDLDRWRVGYGVGFRFAWNLATVVSFDYGRSEESDILYMAFGHQF
jgi:outer membrane protein assembly factor BamA